jgi:hypothetical protein
MANVQVFEQRPARHLRDTALDWVAVVSQDQPVIAPVVAGARHTAENTD